MGACDGNAGGEAWVGLGAVPGIAKEPFESAEEGFDAMTPSVDRETAVEGEGLVAGRGIEANARDQWFDAEPARRRSPAMPGSRGAIRCRRAACKTLRSKTILPGSALNPISARKAAPIAQVCVRGP
jgi:hypothetical protein